MTQYRYYYSIPIKYRDGYVPPRDVNYLYPGSLTALQYVEGEHPFSSRIDADDWIEKGLSRSPFCRFNLLKYSIKRRRKQDSCVVVVQHNELAHHCMAVLEKSLVWSLKHRDVAIGETQNFWREFLDIARDRDALDAQCLELLAKIAKIDHPLMGDIVSEAVMLRMTMATA